ncbi:MAG: DUF58 domain-containing protein [Rhodospirillaceae bacterium]|nr:DUF58 domain-containing protein [Rhodospirillaceae bacterium]
MPPLLVAARRIAASVTLGSHGRRRAGVGDSFWQFRSYSKDDTPQAIDWRQSAKFDQVYVREREWVAAQTAGLWCDTSASMRYRSSPKLPTKAERAAVMMLALAELLVDGGERIIVLSNEGRPQRSATAGGLAIAHLADAMTADLSGKKTANNAPEMPSFAGSLPRHSTAVLFSDFLAPIDVIAESLRTLMRTGIKGHMIQVLDPAEETLPFSGRVRFVGLEQEGATVIDRAEDARAQYMQKLGAHRSALKDLAASSGWSFGLHHTDQSPQLAMAALHSAITGFRR